MLASALGGLVIVLSCAVLVLVVIWTIQRRLIYFPSAGVPAPASIGLAGVERVTFSGADGVILHGWFLRSARSRPWFTVVVFNGNGGNRAYRAPLGDALRTAGCSVLLFDYRGFGENTGSPSEVGLADDARAARTYLLGRDDTDPDRLVYFGESLGTAVAIRLAAEHPPRAMILRSPFVSLVELGQIHYPQLPVRWLLRDRFESIDHIRYVRSPLLMIAGDRDGIVPVDETKRLYAAASLPKRLVIIEGADHNDQALLAGEQIIGAVREFLATLG